jgi:hypothetical protein
VIRYWSTSSPSFLVGGITYNNGALTVPSDGIYYIYKTKHGALLQHLREGDSVAVYGGGYRHYMGPQHSAFGVYKIK